MIVLCMAISRDSLGDAHPYEELVMPWVAIIASKFATDSSLLSQRMHSTSERISTLIIMIEFRLAH